MLDAQLDLLRQVREEKEFAKAVKADGAEVPVYGGIHNFYHVFILGATFARP